MICMQIFILLALLLPLYQLLSYLSVLPKLYLENNFNDCKQHNAR